jgi:nicotine blue oxidoreductase
LHVDDAVAAVVLAAGQGRRLGRGPKAFVRIGGQTLLERATARLKRAGVTLVVAVLPPGPDPVALPDDLVIVRNPRWESGPLGSACLGVAGLPPGVRRVLLYPVDHHAVTDEDVLQVLAGIHSAPRGTARVVPRYEGRGGHPVALLPAAVSALGAVDDPDSTTLRAVLDAAGDVHHVDGVGPGVRQNLNTQTDLPPGERSLATEPQ